MEVRGSRKLKSESEIFDGTGSWEELVHDCGWKRSLKAGNCENFLLISCSRFCGICHLGMEIDSKNVVLGVIR